MGAFYSCLLAQMFSSVMFSCVSLSLQANPPPVVVNTDSLDTPPYVSAVLLPPAVTFELKVQTFGSEFSGPLQRAEHHN